MGLQPKHAICLLYLVGEGDPIVDRPQHFDAEGFEELKHFSHVAAVLAKVKRLPKDALAVNLDDIGALSNPRWPAEVVDNAEEECTSLEFLPYTAVWGEEARVLERPAVLRQDAVVP